jgi:anti-anti-sigma regulatory factor
MTAADEKKSGSETVGAGGGERVLAAINRVFRERLNCKTEEELAKTCLAVAEELTDSKFGFIGELNYAGRFDTIALSNPGWDACKMPGSGKAMLIMDMEVRGIWGRAIREEKSQIVNDPDSDPDRVGTPEGHPPLKAILGVPLKHAGKTIGMMSLGNKEGGYDGEDQKAVESLSVAIVESLRSKRTEDRLARQTEEILEMSTPVMQVWEGVVVAPLIGMLDSQRTQRFMEVLLERIVETNSPVALVDITGVPAIDTQTAQHLIETIGAAQLLGAEVVLTGVRPAIAQTLVHLGIDLGGITTRASLAAGLRVALESAGLEIVAKTGTSD